MNEHLTLADVLRYHERKAREAYDRSRDARASRHTRAMYVNENELHHTLAEIVKRAMPAAPAPQVGNRYTTTKLSPWTSAVEHRCLGCDQKFRAEHAAKFHQCSANAVTQRWTDTK